MYQFFSPDAAFNAVYNTVIVDGVEVPTYYSDVLLARKRKVGAPRKKKHALVKMADGGGSSTTSGLS